MSRIQNKNTRPEMVVRSLAHLLGYRYRLHREDLPGKPDLTFPGLKKVILVNGCFWHMHDCRYGQVVPKTNFEFWQKKRCGNVERDKRNLQKLAESGWAPLVIWECEIRDYDSLSDKIKSFLE